jgi:hypothetical protein
MKPVSMVIIFLSTVILLLSCNTGGYQGIGERIDPYDPLGTDSVSYVRGVVGGPPYTTEVITYSHPGSGAGEFVLTSIVDSADQTSVTITRADYTLSGTDITLTPFVQYRHTYKAGLSNATKITESFNPDISGMKSFDTSGAPVLLYEGSPYTDMRNVVDHVIASASTDLERAQWAYMLCEITLMTAQIRIEGFGGMGMMDYLGRTVTMRGMREGSYEMYSRGTSPNTTDYDYSNYSDHLYLTVDGTQTTSASTSGDGSMEGTLSFDLQGTVDTTTVTIDYSNISIGSTLPDGGQYSVKVGAASPQNVSYTFGRPGALDLSPAIP